MDTRRHLLKQKNSELETNETQRISNLRSPHDLKTGVFKPGQHIKLMMDTVDATV